MTTFTNKKILDSLKDKETRELFAEEHISTGLPFQIHGLREKLGLTQAELARRAGMAQERISVLEDPNYEFLPKIPTLIKLANVFDVPLIVKFGSWLELFDWETNLSPERLAPNSFDEEIDNLERAAFLTAYTVPVRTSAELGTVSYELDHIAPNYRAVAHHGFIPYHGFTSSDPVDARRLHAEIMPSAENIAELLAEASAWFPDGIVTEAPEVTDEKDVPTSASDFFMPVGSDTSIIDYSALKPAA